MRLIESDSPVTSFIGNESTKECIMWMSFVVLRLLLIVGNKLIQTLNKKHVSSHQRD